MIYLIAGARATPLPRAGAGVRPVECCSGRWAAAQSFCFGRLGLLEPASSALHVILD